MGLFDFFRKETKPVFVYDEGDEIYKVEMNGIVFVCEEYIKEFDKYALKLADAYERKLGDIIAFMLPEISSFFEISDPEIIRSKLGKPMIDVNRCVITYLEHTLDYMHIIDVEFDGIFERDEHWKRRHSVPHLR